MTADRDDRPEQPRTEPEIIPPGEARRAEALSQMRMRFDERVGVHRIVIVRPGLPWVVLGLIIVGLIAIVAALVVAGLVLLWIPLLIVVVLVALVSGRLREAARRLHVWWQR